jgi:hypothetical protein
MYVVLRRIRIRIRRRKHPIDSLRKNSCARSIAHNKQSAIICDDEYDDDDDDDDDDVNIIIISALDSVA